MTTAYLPHPVNQFTRLSLVSGARGTGYYVPGAGWNNLHVSPSGKVIDYDALNCTCAAAATLRDAMTGGRSRTSPNTIRNAQNDFSGGIGWDDVNVALGRLGWPKLTIQTSASWADVLQYLIQGRAVGIQGDYDQVPYSYQTQKGGTFDHAFTLHDYRRSDGRVLWFDTLDRKLKWVPQSVIRPAAEKLALVQRGTKLRLFVATTNVVPSPVSVAPKYQVSIHPIPGQTYRNFWVYSVSAVHGRITGRVGVRTKGFSARSTAPQRRYWTLAGKYYELVQLTDGYRKGQYVHAAYAEEM